MGEPARAFYGNQFSLTFPVIDHHGVELWVPEVGGKVDPGSEAHELLMSLFGGTSKDERTRIKLRVRTAMADMTEREGRFLGGRPPYGYRLADAGPHPNPEKRAAGVRLHRLEPDPVTGPVARRIFELYVNGAGFRSIAQTLADEGVPSPSAHDRERNSHRGGVGWAFSAVRSILGNPRYTGRQVWGRQPRQERLLDPERPADGYVTAQDWVAPDQWIRSTERSHEPLVDDETFERARTLLAAKGADTKRTVRSAKSGTPYLFTGMVRCGVCGRKMAGRRITKLVEAVSAGIVEPDEAQGTLSPAADPAGRRPGRDRERRPSAPGPHGRRHLRRPRDFGGWSGSWPVRRRRRSWPSTRPHASGSPTTRPTGRSPSRSVSGVGLAYVSEERMLDYLHSAYADQRRSRSGSRSNTWQADPGLSEILHPRRWYAALSPSTERV